MQNRVELRETREMMPSDLPRVTELAGVLGYPCTLDVMRKRFARVLAQPEQGIFVAAHGAAVVGWVHARANHSLESEPDVEIVGLVVDGAARRAGVGRALVERAAAWAREHGSARLRVRSNVIRPESHAFYAAIGFVVHKTQHCYALALEHRVASSPPTP